MFSSSLSKARLSCACFFLAPGLTYSLFTSRLPAIREQAGLNEAEIGMLILYFGLAALASLLVSATLVRHFGSRSLAIIFTITLLLSITASCAARDALFLACAFMCGGFSMGIADVCINTQGMLLEMRFKSPSMSFLHGAYSFGALFGSLSGALFASFSLSPMINAAVVLGCYSLLLTTAFRGLQKDTDRPASGTARAKKSHVPVFVICCGLHGIRLVEITLHSSLSFFMPNSLRSKPLRHLGLLRTTTCIEPTTFRRLIRHYRRPAPGMFRFSSGSARPAPSPPPPARPFGWRW